MTSLRFNLFHITTLLAVLCLVSTAGLAHHRNNHVRGGDDICADCDPPPPPVVATEDYDWMHPDVGVAHANWTGTGTYISVVDNFSSGSRITGRLVDGDNDGIPDVESKYHGEWTSLMASLVAPGADSPENDTALRYDFNAETPVAVTLHSGFDVINLSYGLIARSAFAGVFNDWTRLGQPHESVLVAAWDVTGNGAFISKAAGNDSGVAVDGAVKGKVDVLALQLIGAPNAIFVGALEWNPDSTGYGGAQEAIASYSSIAGRNQTVQAQFLVVGVEGGRTATDAFASYGSNCATSTNGICLYGTSFAAPIVAGYAAIVAQKFTSGNSPPLPSAVARQLLDTARTDTIVNYDVAVHGQGEADLSYALSPDSLQ